jgi:cystathionine gamma-synthase
MSADGSLRFPYTDTLKVLQKWGPGCHFLGHGLDSDIATLETIIVQELSANPSALPIASLFAEFPSNPLLRSANISLLRALADKYDFLLVIDETIGNFVNVDVLQHADIVVSSLSKIFSGDANVMGGRYISFSISRSPSHTFSHSQYGSQSSWTPLRHAQSVHVCYV